jgi:hypothetical protein
VSVHTGVGWLLDRVVLPYRVLLMHLSPRWCGWVGVICEDAGQKGKVLFMLLPSCAVYMCHMCRVGQVY